MPAMRNPETGETVNVGTGSVASMLASGWVALPEDERPAGNASRDEWAAYAVAQGHTEEEIADLNRDKIKDLF